MFGNRGFPASTGWGVMPQQQQQQHQHLPPRPRAPLPPRPPHPSVVGAPPAWSAKRENPSNGDDYLAKRARVQEGAARPTSGWDQTPKQGGWDQRPPASAGSSAPSGWDQPPPGSSSTPHGNRDTPHHQHHAQQHSNPNGGNPNGHPYGGNGAPPPPHAGGSWAGPPSHMPPRPGPPRPAGLPPRPPMPPGGIGGSGLDQPGGGPSNPGPGSARRATSGWDVDPMIAAERKRQTFESHPPAGMPYGQSPRPSPSSGFDVPPPSNLSTPHHSHHGMIDPLIAARDGIRTGGFTNMSGGPMPPRPPLPPAGLPRANSLPPRPKAPIPAAAIERARSLDVMERQQGESGGAGHGPGIAPLALQRPGYPVHSTPRMGMGGVSMLPSPRTGGPGSLPTPSPMHAHLNLQGGPGGGYHPEASPRQGGNGLIGFEYAEKGAGGAGGGNGYDLTQGAATQPLLFQSPMPGQGGGGDGSTSAPGSTPHSGALSVRSSPRAGLGEQDIKAFLRPWEEVLKAVLRMEQTEGKLAKAHEERLAVDERAAAVQLEKRQANWKLELAEQLEAHANAEVARLEARLVALGQQPI